VNHDLVQKLQTVQEVESKLRTELGIHTERSTTGFSKEDIEKYTATCFRVCQFWQVSHLSKDDRVAFDPELALVDPIETVDKEKISIPGSKLDINVAFDKWYSMTKKNILFQDIATKRDGERLFLDWDVIYGDGMV
jgi:hypothetical protein